MGSVTVAPTLGFVLIRGASAGAALMAVICVLGFGYGLLANSYWLVPLSAVLSAIVCGIYATVFPQHPDSRTAVRVLTAFGTAYVLIAIGSLICGPIYFLATSSGRSSVSAEEFIYPLMYAGVFAPVFTPVLLISTRRRCAGRGFPVNL